MFSIVMMTLPALFLTLLLALIERRQEVKGIPPEHRVVSLDTLFLAIAVSVLGTSALIHLAMSVGLLTDGNDLGTLLFATVMMWATFERMGFGRWIMRRLIKDRPLSTQTN